VSGPTTGGNPRKSGSPAAAAKSFDSILQTVFAALFGLLLGLSLLKFSNPPIMEKLVARPVGVMEWIFFQWPADVSHWLLGIVAILGIIAARWRTKAPWPLVALPLAWLAWQVVAGTQTISRNLSHPTLIHFACCVGCFYLGLFSLSGVKRLWPFWLGLFAGCVVMLGSGLDQHFGGLKETQTYFFQYIYPTMTDVPPEYLKKMTSSRIFGTMFYPNALAGVILMLLPIMVGVVWSTQKIFTVGARRFLVAALAVPALACLYWSGSKGGWLLMLLIGLIATMFLPIKRQLKVALVASVLVIGLAGFGIKYASFFKKGATRVGARFDYWHAALTTTGDHPLLGTGPGTFFIPYQRLKKPESEMARLVHNDYLEQASDSGIPGFLAYAGLMLGGLVYCFRKGRLRDCRVELAVWLGVLGWALQGTMEFGLYVPASAWIAFTFLGWLLGRTSNQIDSRPAAG